MRRSGFIARQGRQPSGLLGHIVGRIMARETHAANLVTLDLLDLAPGDAVLEVGFGHGRTLAEASHLVTQGSLAGIDPSEVMMKIARKRNAAVLRGGRMELKLGTSDALPWTDGHFDKAYAVHTIYFWPQPARDLAEIYRVLKPGGRLVLGYRPGEDAGFARDFPPDVYTIRAVAEIERLVSGAGFSDVDTHTRPFGRGLIAWTAAQKA